MESFHEALALSGLPPVRTARRRFANHVRRTMDLPERVMKQEVIVHEFSLEASERLRSSLFKKVAATCPKSVDEFAGEN